MGRSPKPGRSRLWSTASRLVDLLFALPRKVRLTIALTATSLLVIFNILDLAAFMLKLPKHSDFFLYYVASQIGLTKGWASMYDPNVYIPSLWQASHRWMPYLNPPPLGWLVAPFTFLPYPVALAIWTAAMFAALLLAGSLLAPGGRLDRVAHVLALLGLPIVELLLRLGQVVSLIFAAVAGCWWLIRRGKPLLAGMVLGLMVLKPQVALLVPLALLVAGYRRVFVGWALVAIPLALASVLAIGTRGLRNFQAATDALSQVHPMTMFSANWAVSRPAAVVIAILAFALTVSAAWRARHRGPELPIAAGLVGSTLVVPYLFVYDLTSLVLSAWLALRVGLPRWLKVLLLLAYAPLIFINSDSAVVPALVFRSAWLIALFALSARPRQIWLPRLEPAGPRARRVVVLPAYRAEKTLRDVVAGIPRGEADRILLVDDASLDRTAEVALELGIDVIKHPRNLGYGGNQKTCYANALLMGAEVVVMLHPDGQYDPGLVPALCQAVEEGKGDVVLGSRWLGLDPAAAGMPSWKRMGNRFLTWTENRLLGLNLSEYHTGYRAYSRRFLETIPFAENSNDFVFDTQVLVQAASFGFRIAEIPAVGRYFEDASSIGFKTSVVYGLKTLGALTTYLAREVGLPSRWLKPRRMLPSPAITSEQAAA
jgi:glycosyl transferase family 87/glycosyl transferase family 2